MNCIHIVEIVDNVDIDVVIDGCILFRYHKIGLLVLFLHDIADICLEFTKCNVYLKNRGGKVHQLNDHLSTIGFLCFASTW